MLDNLAILSTLAMLVLVAVRAIRLDREEPWFPPLKPNGASDSEPGSGDSPPAPGRSPFRRRR